MITAERKAANAVGGKTARPCDSCLCKRARWYCAADDAFLCQGCDASVHSANQLASRHERVRLGTALFKATDSEPIENSQPAWHQGFTRKARTPRHAKGKQNMTSTSPLVPDISSEEASLYESEEQLLYRVPIFDPFAAELCNISNETVVPNNVMFNDNGYQEACDLDNINGFLPSDMELAEFAADVESLLGTGLDKESCGMEALGLIDCKEEDGVDVCFGENRVKVEDEEVEGVITCHLDSALEVTRETLDWNFDYESPATVEEEDEEKVVVGVERTMMDSESKVEVQKNMVLRLNYDEVIATWANQGSPWTSGSRPEFNPDDFWPDFMGMCPTGIYHPYGGFGGRLGGGDGGREARVSRYREKRRTRLFSKKIRYEVRKLNAEKRPRMKGRFVKRAPFAGPAFPYLMNK